jgi:outer membrane protein
MMTAGLAALASMIAVSTAAAAQTLTEALAEAYQTNPQLLAQRALLRATDEMVPQALAGWRPTVAFTGQTGYAAASGPPSLAGGSTAYSHTQPASLDLNVTEPVYNGGRTVAQTRQAIATIEAARAQTLAVETTVFQAVAQAYLDVLRDQALLEVQRDNEKVLWAELVSTRTRARIGELTQTQVAQAQSAYEQAVATRTAAAGQLGVSRAGYARAVGHPPGVLLPPRERPALPATRADALRLAAADNPNVIAAAFAELAARDNVDVIRGQLLPQIALTGDLNRSSGGASTMTAANQPSPASVTSLTQTASITATMTGPVYEGGAVWSQTRQAQQTVGQRQSQVDDARRAAAQAAADAWAALKAARSGIASYGAAVRAAQIALAGLEKEALTGERTVLDVLVGEQQLLTTQSQLVVVEHDAALAEFTIAAAIGRLIAPELRLPVRLDDFDRHFREVRDKWIGLAGGLQA